MCPPSRLGAFGAATILALSAVACSPRSRADEPSAPPTSPDRPAPVSPTLRPSWPPAASFPTRWPIKHVVFLIKENRTFDNLFGTFPGTNGAASADDNGTIRPLTRGTDGRLPGDLPHCYVCALQAWNSGRMDGFDEGGLSTRWAFTRLVRAQLPNYWHWAKQFVLADNFFASAQGPSFPNHLYSIAAQSGGAVDNPRRTGFFSDTF
ncbi:MAG TPA: alkaline phosphatase family protein, partial [Actinomycetota bacterium]|nr:alkaline phosphatase family protein [Actinomycetota bacterium]